MQTILLPHNLCAPDCEGLPLPNALIFNSPGLLDDVVGPHQAAHVPGAVVEAGEGLQGAGDGVGQHQDERNHPGGGDDLGGVRFGLPRPGGQRVADGTVALQGDGHQVEGGNTYRDAFTDQTVQTCSSLIGFMFELHLRFCQNYGKIASRSCFFSLCHGRSNTQHDRHPHKMSPCLLKRL